MNGSVAKQREKQLSHFEKKATLSLKRVHDWDVIYFEENEMILNKDQVQSKVKKALRQAQGRGLKV